MRQTLQDLRYAVRILFRRPGFTAVVVMTLALGIGVTTAMFGILDAVVLTPLPYRESDQLVRIHTQRADRVFGSTNGWEYFDILENTQSFQSIGLYQAAGVNLSDGRDDPEYVSGVRLSSSVLEMLGVEPAIGRLLQPQETFAGQHQVAILSHRLWRRRFGESPGIVGSKLQILNEIYEVIGVMPEGFGFPDKNAELWVGFGLDREQLGHRGAHPSQIVARLRDSIPVATAQADLDLLSARLRREYPDIYQPDSGFRLVAQPLLENVTGSVRPALLMLMGAVAFVLLIACANVTNLLLIRMADREREIAIRVAAGASRGRILQQILTESLVPTALGGFCGLVIAKVAVSTLVRFHPATLPRAEEVAIDTRIFLFNMVLILVTTLGVGLISGWRVSRLSISERLKQGGCQVSGIRNRRIGTTLVIGEVTLATLLLIGAGLMIRSLGQLLTVDPGFEADSVMTTQLTLSVERYPDSETRTRFVRQLVDGIKARPDMVSAAVTTMLPMSGNRMDWYVSAEGYTPTDPNSSFIQYREVTPDYFRTLGIPVIRGRAFGERDDLDAAPVAIVSASLAKRFWGDADPIGRRIKPGQIDSTAPWLLVVGVVGDIHHSGQREGSVPIWYRPLYQRGWNWLSLAVRTTAETSLAVRTIKDVLGDIDSRQPIYNNQPMIDLVSDSLSQERFNTHLMIAFGGMALGLALIGIFGVLSYSVNQRIREIGVRRALGARTHQVVGQILREGFRVLLTGLALGTGSAVVLAHLLESMLFGVTGFDPVTLGLIACLLLCAGFVACLVPARRAVRVDPVVALRYE